MPENAVFAGKIEKDVRENSKTNIAYIDLLDREEMAVLNAIPAAERGTDNQINTKNNT